MSWFKDHVEINEADRIRDRYYTLKFKAGGVMNDDLLDDIDKLQNKVLRMKAEGVSMWNYKSQIPKVFDIVDGAFEIMREMAKQLKNNSYK